MNELLIETPGMLTTLQDAGRFGYQQYGVSPAGPMDARSFALVNCLVGNPMDACGLEISYLGPVIRINADTVFAVTGGDLSPELNGTPIPSYCAIRAKAGDVLQFGAMHGKGSRAYLAFAGGLDAPLVMNSRSTLVRNHIGGLHGDKLKKGDCISLLDPEAGGKLNHIERRKIEPEKFGEGSECVLRVVLGPQASSFTRKGIRHFFWFPFRITDEFDRMGCRLKREEAVEHLGDGNIISDGIAFGSIQVPPNGQPIIMLADRQSTGGYAKIGTVISVDLPLLAQGVPGDTVRFVETDVDLAQTLYLRQLSNLKKLAEMWK